MPSSKQQRMLAGFEETPPGPLEDGCLLGALRASTPSVYVLDSHYLLFQVFHALPDIRSPIGAPVAAVHGFIQDVVGVIEKKRADYVFCAFDSPFAATFRRQRCPTYKANREEMPEDLRLQVPVVRRLLEAMRIPALESAGYEADDVLATVAREAERRSMACFLVTGDKDCRQLLSERVKIFNIRKNELFDDQSLMQAWGIKADQVVDFLALVGDAVDNIPGVPLIGPKTAGQLLAQYKTLDNLLTRVDEVSGAKRQTNLRGAREQLLLSRSLVRLVDNVPLQIDWESSRIGKLDQRQIQPICQELGLHRLAERLSGLCAILAERIR